MTIEYLFYDVGVLYGDQGHLPYFNRLFTGDEIIYTRVSETPHFAEHQVDLIYLGAMTETHQKVVLEKLRPIRDRLWSLIENGTFVLFTHNAMDLLGNSIRDDAGEVAGLGLFDFSVTVQRWPRINQFVLGDWDGLAITAHKTQFTKTTFGPGMDDKYWFRALKGMGANPHDPREGIHYKNVYCTQCMGPFFVINPLVMKKILHAMGRSADLPAEEVAMAAYEARLAEFQHEKASQAMEVV